MNLRPSVCSREFLSPPSCYAFHCFYRTRVCYVGTKGVSQFYHLSFDDNKVLKLSIGYAKSLFKCTGPLSKIYS